MNLEMDGTQQDCWCQGKIVAVFSNCDENHSYGSIVLSRLTFTVVRNELLISSKTFPYLGISLLVQINKPPPKNAPEKKKSSISFPFYFGLNRTGIFPQQSQSSFLTVAHLRQLLWPSDAT
jgi:hypothetical protein